MGGMSTVNGVRNDALTVSSEFSDMRIWRNTAAANLAPGTTYTMPVGTLGYEWGGDVDNGFRPAGLVNLSSTTIEETLYGAPGGGDGAGGGLFVDYGSTTAAGSGTNNLTLYRADSGALVFSTQTVQWSWGLDAVHDAPGTATDVAMQQATVNLFADMGIQPGSLMAELTPAIASIDTSAPTTTFTVPSEGATYNTGQPVSVTGTAADVGGVVGGVEVSVDGTTWHPAVPTGADRSYSTWSYAWTPSVLGAVTVRARAADDSANRGANATVPVTVTYSCPCSILGMASSPATPATGDSSAVELGVKFRSDIGGYISGVRFYKSEANTGTHVGSLWSRSGARLATATFSAESASGWQEVSFSSPVAIEADTTYVASYSAPAGRYAADSGVFARSEVVTEPLRALQSGADGGNGVFAHNLGEFPTVTFGDTNYWVDPVFIDTLPPDVTAPVVTVTSPVAGATGVSTSVVPSATFSEPVQAGTISFTVRDSADTSVVGTVSYNSATSTASFIPSTPLATSSVYTATVSGALDVAGNSMVAPTTWSFTTPSVATTVSTIWSAGATPEVLSAGDSGSVELGVKFRSDVAGTVTGVRFFKGVGNSGTHVGNLWSASGSLLATATFSGESASGWQEVSFSSPVAIEADTTYVASYFAPNGRYSATADGLVSASVNAPLRALAGPASGGNGVYRYGSASQFPTASYRNTNYWVDVVFTTAAPVSDTTAPTVTSTTPTAGATDVATSTPSTATFSEPVQAGTISFTVRDSADTSVVGTVSYNTTTRTATFAPSTQLATSTVYTVLVSGALDPAGNAMAAPTTWSFTTSDSPTTLSTVFSSGVTPILSASSDSGAVELGMKFRSDVAGTVTGVRFFKGAGNTGTHVGNLWSASGTLLATATFSNETESGWQQVSFSSPVAIEPNTTYVVSYFAPNGRYAADNDFFASAGFGNGVLHALSGPTAGGNGLYQYGTSSAFPTGSYRATNYWVDVVFASA